jgi:FkbM family methyltransferase
MNIASLVYKHYLDSKGVSNKFLALCRKLLIKIAHDPSCILEVNGRLLRLPLSHPLPLCLSRYPFFQSLLGRLSKYIHIKYGYLTCIDVGGNIGDSVAAFYQNDSDRFLVIEPNERFCKYLFENWGNTENVRIQTYICSSVSEQSIFRVFEKQGSASMVRADTGISVVVKSLDDLVTLNPDFTDFNLLKSHTDGHDFEVIAGAKKVISSNLPAILCEIDPSMNYQYSEDFLEMINFLKDTGYSSLLLYNNFGHLMGKYSLVDLKYFANLLFYHLTSRSDYLDILLMKEEDIASFFEAEQAYFIDTMPDKAFRRTANVSAELCRSLI